MACPAEADPCSRRNLLTTASTVGTGAAAGLLSGCAGSKPLRIKVRSGATVARADVETLNRLLDLEHYAVAAYTAGIPLLRRPAAKAAAQLLAQELAHTVQLSDLIRHAGGKPNRPRSSYQLGHPRGASHVLSLLERVEDQQIAGYLMALPGLTGGRLRSAVASIFANEAQHRTVLRWQSGQAPVPAALVV